MGIVVAVKSKYMGKSYNRNFIFKMIENNKAFAKNVHIIIFISSFSHRLTKIADRSQIVLTFVDI